MSETKHFDSDKLGLQWILSIEGLEDVAKVGDYGAKKYGQNNWRAGSEWMRFAGSCTRHLTRYICGEFIDPESGLPHLAHCAYNCLILLTWAKEGKGKDDRPTMVEASKGLSLDSGVPCSFPKLMHLDPVPGDDCDCEIVE